MIYGEEQKEVDITKGLWLTDETDSLPEGYAINLVNMEVNLNGLAEIRPNFLPLIANAANPFSTGPVYTGSPPNPTGYGILSSSVQTFDLAPVTPSGDSPAFVASIYTTSGAVATRWIWITNRGTVYNALVTSPTVSFGTVTFSMCQYRDRHYGLSGGLYSAGVADVYRYAFGAGTVTPTLVVSLPALCKNLVTYKDRIFAFAAQSSRVYYTELATVGGYPDNWNAGANFFDLPDTGAIIQNVFSLNDRLYIFTNRGLYNLFAEGAPSTWQTRLVNTDIKIYDKAHVALVDGVFMFTNTKTVYAYNGGSSIVEVGEPIKYAMNARVRDFDIPISSSVQTYSGPTDFRILPWDQGFLLTLGYHSTTNTQVRAPKYYYYNGRSWSEVRFDTDLASSYQHYELAGVNVGKSKVCNIASTTEPAKYSDVFLEIRSDGTSTYSFALKAIRRDNSDIDLANHEFQCAMVTRDTDLNDGVKIARIKEANCHTKSTLTGFTISIYVDGAFSNSYAPVLAASGGTYKHRVPITIQRGTSALLTFLATFNKSSGTGGDQSVYAWPSLKINRLLFKINSDTRNQPTQETLS